MSGSPAAFGFSGGATYPLMAAAFGKHGEEAVLAKIEADFKARKVGVTLDSARIRLELDRCLAEAKKQMGMPR